MYARFFRWASDRLDANGILAFVTNRSFIESRTFDGFRKTVAAEFADIYVVDLGGDVRANLKLSGTKHNVFGIQTGVAISFMVKSQHATKDKKPARVYYARRPEMETAEEKRNYLASHPMRAMDFDEVSPDKNANWVNLTHNDFDSLMPLASKETKAAKTSRDVKAIFRKFSLGVVTARDEWVYGNDAAEVEQKVRFLIEEYNAERMRLVGKLRARKGLEDRIEYRIKWSRAVKNDLSKHVPYNFASSCLISSEYRPFNRRALYFSKQLNEMQYLLREIFGVGQGSLAIAISGVPASKQFQTLALASVPSYDFLEKTQTLPLFRYEMGQQLDNITDWALKQFTAHYKASEPSPPPSPSGRGSQADAGEVSDRLGGELGGVTEDVTLPSSGGRESQTEAGEAGGVASGAANNATHRAASGAAKARKITKPDIFHYCYAVLHDPLYREKYAQNLKREFPRIPFYADFWRWADWGAALMALHIGYEAVEPFALTRTNEPDARARAAGQSPKPALKSDAAAGSITLDSETVLRGVPPEAWAYKLGNRSAIDWVLDQHKEKKPKDPTIRAQFDTYRFADYKEKVVDLLMRVTTVCVETVRITEAMRSAAR